MLTRADRYRILTSLRLVCNLNPFPLEVNLQSCNVISGRDRKWKVWLCKVTYALFIIHACYKVFRLAKVLLFLPTTPLHQVIIHGVLAAAGVIVGFWHYWLYYKCADVMAAYARITLSGNIAGGKGKKEAKIMYS